jgi:hypothetical protein
MKSEKPVFGEYGDYKVIFEGMTKENSEAENLLPAELAQEIKEIEELRRFSSELKNESGFFYSSTA